MDFNKIISLQGMLFLLILTGFFARKKNIIPKTSGEVMTDLLINIILPCNIIDSFRTELDMNILVNFVKLFCLALGIQFFAIGINFFIYRNQDIEKQKVLKYVTVLSNAGFMGIAVIDGIYGSIGCMYGAISLISQRALLWSVGLAYFTNASSKKELIKKILTHPCLVTVYIGILIMVFQISFPEFLGGAIKSIGKTTTPFSMMLVGVILGEMKNVKNFFSKIILFFSSIRLIILPLIVFIVGKLLNFDDIIIGVQVLITGMPAASTSAILASKYNGDVDFATQCILVTSMLSMITIPIWCMILKV